MSKSAPRHVRGADRSTSAARGLLSLDVWGEAEGYRRAVIATELSQGTASR